MTAAFNPAPWEKLLLAMIRWNESGGNYQSPPKDPIHLTATASGAYQFIMKTWAGAASITGVGSQYRFAFQAPPDEQDINALWLLRQYGANNKLSWKASGPYPAQDECMYVAQTAGIGT